MIPGLDIPGHSSSWCAGEPTICPSACPTPLSPASNATRGVFTDVASDLLTMFSGTHPWFHCICHQFPLAIPARYRSQPCSSNVAGPLHFGGDEVWVQCWDASPEVGQWLQANNLSSQEAIFDLMNVTHSVAVAAGRSVLHYQEVGHPVGHLSAHDLLP